MEGSGFRGLAGIFGGRFGFGDDGARRLVKENNFLCLNLSAGVLMGSIVGVMLVVCACVVAFEDAG